MNAKPTKKQLEFIKVMESYLYPYYYEEEGILFKGTTKQEASKWISDNIDDFKRIQIEVDGMTKVEQEEFGFL